MARRRSGAAGEQSSSYIYLGSLPPWRREVPAALYDVSVVGAKLE